MKLAWLLPLAACSTQSGQAPATVQTQSQETEAALVTALADERDAAHTYEAVMSTHGAVRPFANIVHAERRHQQALITLFERYKIDVPRDENRSVEAPGSLASACANAVQAEKRNIAMYDQLLGVVEHADIRETFLRLQAASRDRHLPAFQRCADRRAD